jgi:hypothetical protein
MESFKGVGSILKEAMQNIDKKKKTTGPNYLEFRENMRKLFNDRNMFPDEQSACKE